MGITGLLPLLKPISKQLEIKNINNEKDKNNFKSIGIDAYVWLHRASYSCALDLVAKQSKDAAISRVVAYCIRRLGWMLDLGVETPWLVFDGANLPSKAVEEQDRKSKRIQNRALVMDLLASGKRDKAVDEARKCVSITPFMAHRVILEIRRLQRSNPSVWNKVKYLVAPYEADAQLCFMQKEGLIDAILTEDSDLIAFGCNNVIYKSDFIKTTNNNNGGRGGNTNSMVSSLSGTLVSASEIGQIKEFRYWTQKQFRHLCILSGCDYLPSIPGIGLKKAEKCLQQKKSGYTVVKDWFRLGSIIGAPSNIPHDYLSGFARADFTFLYQRVYCPNRNRLVTLHPCPDGRSSKIGDSTKLVNIIGTAVDANDVEEADDEVVEVDWFGEGVDEVGLLEVGDRDFWIADFIGPIIPDELATRIANGDVDPMTRLPFGDRYDDQDGSPPSSGSQNIKTNNTINGGFSNAKSKFFNTQSALKRSTLSSSSSLKENDNRKKPFIKKNSDKKNFWGNVLGAKFFKSSSNESFENEDQQHPTQTQQQQQQQQQQILEKQPSSSSFSSSSTHPSLNGHKQELQHLTISLKPSLSASISQSSTPSISRFFFTNDTSSNCSNNMNNNHIYSYKKIDHERDQLPVLRLRDEPKTEQGNDNWNEDDEGEGDHKVMIVEDGEDDIAVVMEVPLIHPVTSPTPPPPPTSASHSGFVKANAADWKSIFAFKGSIGGNATEEGKKIIGPRVKKRSPNKNNNKKSNLTSSTSSSSSRMKSSPAAAVPYSSTTTSATRSGHAQPDLLQKSQLRMGLSASFAYKSKGGGGGGMKL